MDSQAALQALQSFQQPSSADVLTQAQTKYGIPDLQKRVSDFKTLTGNLTGAIAAVDPSVTGRTAGSLTTEGQRSALVSREKAPIVGQLGTANDALTTANSDYNTADTNAKGEANATIADNTAKYQRLKDTYDVANAREEAARQAAAAEADRQEQVRQFNEQQTTARGASSYSGGSGKAPSAADTKAAVQQHVTQQLASSTGKDGYVSNETFAAALNDWQATGGTPRTFWQSYGRYANPKYISKYAGYAQR